MKESRTVSTLGIIIAAAILSHGLVSLGRSVEKAASNRKPIDVRITHDGSSQFELISRDQ